ncbi:MAG: stage II sporulation protein M [Planctomycetota bacterium]|nr:stage II sporulation protein M [Planctomycetota bacterium]
MRTAELVEQRRKAWISLDELCDVPISRWTPQQALRFSALYRDACSDLAMADQLRLPPATIEYLQRLVARSHSRLYSSNSFPVSRWYQFILKTAPQAVFSDICVRIAFCVFFGMFSIAAFLGWAEGLFPNFAETIVGTEQIESIERMYSQPLAGNYQSYTSSAAYYIQHNTSIGLQCFALGPLILPTILKLAYNALSLGAIFGYMARPGVSQGDNFFQFVTAHGVFELTAIALSAAAGLRLGLGWIATDGLTRLDSFKKNAEKALPLLIVAVMLFILAAFTEGFISPSPLPYYLKILCSVGSASLLMFYFCVLGYPPDTMQPNEHPRIGR